MSPPSIALSIVRWTRIGIASESPVKTSAQREPDRDQAPLGPPERVEVAQRRPELQVGWIDVLHARVGLLAAGRVGTRSAGHDAVAPASTASDTPPGAGLRGGRTAHSISAVGRDIARDFKSALDRHHYDVIHSSHGHRTARSGNPGRPRGRGRARRRGDRPRRASASRRPSRSSLQLRLLDVLTDASLALNAQLSSGHVEVRLAGRDPDLVFVDDRADEAEPAPAPGDDLSARITLRLPEALKVQIEVVASSEGVSANAWIVRALARALEPRRGTDAQRQPTSGLRPELERGASPWPFITPSSAASSFPIVDELPPAPPSPGRRPGRPPATARHGRRDRS